MSRSLYRLEDGHNVSATARANIVSNDQWAVLNEPRSLLARRVDAGAVMLAPKRLPRLMDDAP
ncbi:MAG: hypothetical protein F6K00_25480 [Leptolyngbya sp. SIOISBB]|nr:hypothetical protein [Leptolyngbya sp. SIOISBB]